MTRVYLSALSISCALGTNAGDVAKRLFSTRTRADSPLAATEAFSPGAPVRLGRVPEGFVAKPEHGPYACRNNTLLEALALDIETPLAAAIERFGRDRIGVVLATSTSGIDEAEQATQARLARGVLPDDFHFLKQKLSGGTDFIAQRFGLDGPTSTISTACSSSAHILASAARLIRADLADAVLVGGADTLCRFTVQGFAALEAVSADLANPFSVNRDGINVGEGGALFLMTREESEIALVGAGASSDAHHISAPHPEGLGAQAAMRQALAEAGLAPGDVDYVNLHGTGTKQNDLAEGRAIADVLGLEVSCSSTKPVTGHTLGAAGIIEAGLCWLSMRSDFNAANALIPHVWDEVRDPDIPAVNLVTQDGGSDRPSVCLSNSFAFGGNNACVVLAA